MSKLDFALKKLQKKYDSGIILDMRKGDIIFPEIERIQIDSPKIGEILGGGGYPRGRIIEIFGPESGGKSSLATYISAHCQKTTFSNEDDNGKVKKRKGMVLFVDAEHAFDPVYAQVHGFDLQKCIFIRPDNGEQALEIIITLVESGEVDLVIIDSIAALTPIAEIEADMDQMQMGLQARLISKFLRKITSTLSNTQTTMICLNQVRANIGGYGNPETTPGGKALKFYASIRIEVRRKEWIEEKGKVVGLVIAMKSVKNKTAPPMKKHLVEMSFTKGFDAHLEWLEFAIEYDVVKRLTSVTYESLGGEKIKSKAGIIEFYSLEEHYKEYLEVIEKTKEIMYKIRTSNRVSVDVPLEEEDFEEDFEEIEETPEELEIKRLAQEEAKKLLANLEPRKRIKKETPPVELEKKEEILQSIKSEEVEVLTDSNKEVEEKANRLLSNIKGQEKNSSETI